MGSSEENRLTNKTKPEAGIHGTDGQVSEGRRGGALGEISQRTDMHVGTAHRHRPQSGEGQRGVGAGWRGGQRGKNKGHV